MSVPSAARYKGSDKPGRMLETRATAPAAVPAGGSIRSHAKISGNRQFSAV